MSSSMSSKGAKASKASMVKASLYTTNFDESLLHIT